MGLDCKNGYPWAPSTLLNHRGTYNEVRWHVTDDSLRQGRSADKGLLVHLLGADIQLPTRFQLRLSVSWYHYAIKENWFRVRGSDQKWHTVDDNQQKNALVDDSSLDLLQMEGGLYVLSTDFEQTVIHTSREPSNDRLLVRLESENAGVRYVRSLRHVQMKRCPESFSIVFEAAYQCAQQLARSEVGQSFLNKAPNMYSEYPERFELDEKLKSELGRIVKLVEKTTLDMVKIL